MKDRLQCPYRDSVLRDDQECHTWSPTCYKGSDYKSQLLCDIECWLDEEDNGEK